MTAEVAGLNDADDDGAALVPELAEAAGSDDDEVAATDEADEGTADDDARNEEEEAAEPDAPAELGPADVVTDDSEDVPVLLVATDVELLAVTAVAEDTAELPDATDADAAEPDVVALDVEDTAPVEDAEAAPGRSRVHPPRTQKPWPRQSTSVVQLRRHNPVSQCQPAAHRKSAVQR